MSSCTPSPKIILINPPPPFEIIAPCPGRLNLSLKPKTLFGYTPLVWKRHDQSKGYFFFFCNKYVMWLSKKSRNSQMLFLRYSQTKPIVSFVLYCLFNPSTACIFRTSCPISVRFSPNSNLNNTLIENAEKPKIIFFDFRLILLDRITYGLYPGGALTYESDVQVPPSTSDVGVFRWQNASKKGIFEWQSAQK